MNLQKKSALSVAAGAVVGLLGLAGISIGVAAASVVASPSGQVAPATPATFTTGTYDWYVNGEASGTISFAADFEYTSTVDSNDSGAWVESGNTIALSISSGADAASGCVFVGKVTSSTTIGSAAKPGKYSCPGISAAGTFYIGALTAAPRVTAGLATATRTAAAPPLAFATGKYNFFNGVKLGYFKFLGDSLFTSDIDGDDAGTWVSAGSGFAMAITSSGASSGDVGCLFVGKLTTTGINSEASPAPYACGGTIQGDWWANKKG